MRITAHRSFVLSLSLLLLAVGAVSAAPLTKQQQVQIKKAQKACKRGDDALQKGDVARAREMFQSAVESYAEFPPGRIGLGHVALTESDFAEALNQYERAKKAFGEMGEITFQIQQERFRQTQAQIRELRDHIQRLQMNRAGSAEDFTRGSTRTTNPSQATAQQNDARVSQLENKIRQLEAVAPPDEEEIGAIPPEVDFYIGNAQFQLGDVSAAVASWESCAARNRKFGLVHNNLALGYWRLGELGRALESLDQADKLGFPVNPKMRADLEAAYEARAAEKRSGEG